ncbi:MAG TPA: type II secretion system protein M [Thiotrichales bacterium]|nr:type II secretion system protein M [Thiotrichales bacterium]
MREWFLSREPRERVILVVAAILTLGVLLHMVIVEPLTEASRRAVRLEESRQATLVWLKSALRELDSLRGRQSTAPAAGGQSLLSLVDRTARQAGLRDRLKKVEPRGSQQAQLWFEEVPFDRLVSWLGELHGRHGYRVVSITIDRQEGEGLVNARLLIGLPK